MGRKALIDIEEFIGKKIEGSRLTIIKEIERQNGKRMVNVLCECGAVKDMYLWNAVTAKTRSCGCLFIDSITTHGYTKHPLFGLFKGIKSRCRYKNSEAYKNYGGRGISICNEWLKNPEKFIEWALSNGYEEGLQIDRIDNDGNYEPSNCRFVTSQENNANRRKRKDNPTGYTGVIKKIGGYSYRVTIDGVHYRDGLFKTSLEAAKARELFILKKESISQLNFKSIEKESVPKIKKYNNKNGYYGVTEYFTKKGQKRFYSTYHTLGSTRVTKKGFHNPMCCAIYRDIEIIKSRSNSLLNFPKIKNKLQDKYAKTNK